MIKVQVNSIRFFDILVSQDGSDNVYDMAIDKNPNENVVTRIHRRCRDLLYRRRKEVIERRQR